MTDQTERYDEIAAGYATWWAPVIAPPALRVLDEIVDAVDAGATDILDVGTGTGTLAIGLVRRWPDVRVVAIDASSEMIEHARREAAGLLRADQRDRIDFRVARADDLGLDDAEIDVAVSSFVLQLVPNRFAALREVRRVLRPRGLFAWSSWLKHDRPWAPDGDFDDALEEVGEEARAWEDRPGDLRSLEAAVAQMRRAGFRDVRAVRDEVNHPFDADTFARFMAEFDAEDIVASLPSRVRRRFDAALQRRLAARTPAELALRQPTLRVRGLRS